MRANVLANRADWAGDAARDADEAWRSSTGSATPGARAEALSARGEAREKRGEYAQRRRGLPGGDRARRTARGPGPDDRAARPARPRADRGRPEASEGERILREVLGRGQRERATRPMPAARLFLAAVARPHRPSPRRVPSSAAARGVRVRARRRLRRRSSSARWPGWTSWRGTATRTADAGSGRPWSRRQDPLAQMVAPQMPVGASAHRRPGARSADRGGEAGRDAARLLGRLRRPAAARPLPPRATEREDRARAEARGPRRARRRGVRDRVRRGRRPLPGGGHRPRLTRPWRAVAGASRGTRVRSSCGTCGPRAAP